MSLFIEDLNERQKSINVMIDDNLKHREIKQYSNNILDTYIEHIKLQITKIMSKDGKDSDEKLLFEQFMLFDIITELKERRELIAELDDICINYKKFSDRSFIEQVQKLREKFNLEYTDKIIRE